MNWQLDRSNMDNYFKLETKPGNFPKKFVTKIHGVKNCMLQEIWQNTMKIPIV